MFRGLCIFGCPDSIIQKIGNMVKIKPFRGIRPPRKYAAEVASRPYDVLNSQEAKKEATEKSLLHIIKPEIDFDPIADEMCIRDRSSPLRPDGTGGTTTMTIPVSDNI